MELFLYILFLIGIVVAIVVRVRHAYGMKLVVCVIRPEQLGDLVNALKRESFMAGMTTTNVRGFGRQHAETQPLEQSEEIIRFLPKLKIEILIPAREIQRTVDVIRQSLHTGQIGDGKIVVFDLVTVVRIRTGEKGVSAL